MVIDDDNTSKKTRKSYLTVLRNKVLLCISHNLLKVTIVGILICHLICLFTFPSSIAYDFYALCLRAIIMFPFRFHSANSE